MSSQNENWNQLWANIHELSEEFDSRLVFIGGVAVYLHVLRDLPKLVEVSHDADFYISLSDFSALRDMEEVTKNARLSKYQIIKDNVDFDVYVERQNRLPVSYEEVERFSILIHDVRVASLEHLLVLKLAAYLDRRGTKKGEKDERDIIRLGVLLGRDIDLELSGPYLNSEMLAALIHISRVSQQFISMTQRNAQEASRLRKKFNAMIARL